VLSTSRSSTLPTSDQTKHYSRESGRRLRVQAARPPSVTDSTSCAPSLAAQLDAMEANSNEDQPCRSSVGAVRCLLVEDGAVDLGVMVTELLDEYGTPGAAVGMVDGADGEAIVTAGSRGHDRGRVEDDTMFAAASLTKPVFAAGVMALVDGGALELDRPLSTYVPEPYLADDLRAASITARMVLSHTTGFPNWRDGSLYLRWTPGTRWGYSGEGFSYLQQVVERLVGAPVGDHLSEAVLRPIGMADSTFVWPQADEPRLAIGHDRDGEPRPPFRPSPAKAAAGGMFTTAPDYVRFLHHCLVHEQRMFEQQARIDEELGWGLGWGIESAAGTCVWQWGNDPGYKNFVIGRPAEGRGLVVFTNGDRGAHVYAEVMRRLLSGDHPSLATHHRPSWMRAMARRPVDLRPQLDWPEVRSLLEAAAVHGARDEGDHIVERYRQPGTWLLGVVTQGSVGETGLPVGTPIACVGIERRGEQEANVKALAVLPGWRGQGIGASLIYGACEHLRLQALETEADGSAVEFFRAIGFDVESRPGRRRCRLDLSEG
jgi:CubicO group peptidase (beta-lactamase class C family)